MSQKTKKDRYHVITLPGDGIGPEVTAQAVRALEVAAKREGVGLQLEEIAGGGEHYLAHGVEWAEGSDIPTRSHHQFTGVPYHHLVGSAYDAARLGTEFVEELSDARVV